MTLLTLESLQNCATQPFARQCIALQEDKPRPNSKSKLGLISNSAGYGCSGPGLDFTSSQSFANLRYITFRKTTYHLFCTILLHKQLDCKNHIFWHLSSSVFKTFLFIVFAVELYLINEYIRYDDQMQWSCVCLNEYQAHLIFNLAASKGICLEFQMRKI